MKFIKCFIIISLSILILSTISYCYEKPGSFAKTYLYKPKDTNNEIMKIIVLFYNYMNKYITSQTNKNLENNSEVELANWQAKAEQENFFILGFDLTRYTFVNKVALDAMNKKIENELELLQMKYTHKETKIYIAGSHYSGALSIVFNVLYDTYNACISMNGNELLNFARDNIKLANGKKFYLFQGEKNTSFTLARCNITKNKLEQKGAIVKLYTYKDVDYIFPSVVYADAIDRILLIN